MDKLISLLLENGIFLSMNGYKLDIEFDGDSIPDNLLEEIAKNKDKLLEYITRNRLRSNYQDIIPVNSLGPFKLSSAQRRLWVLSQFEEGSVAYNMPGSTYMNKGIDFACFKRAIESTIARHEILRTVFKEDETGEIRQWIISIKDLGFSLGYQDYRKEENKDEKIQNYISEDSVKPFDLEKGPLLRATLLHVEDERYVFYFNMHHIISDGWSMEVLTKDVFSYYEAYKENKEPELKELRIQYKDYSAWQLSHIGEESFKAHRTYWLENLRGELPLLDLPITRQRPRLKTHNGRTFGTYLNKEISGKLKEFSRQQGGTLFMGLLASLHALFYRYSGQVDQIIGSPIAGREHADLEDQIGFYVNTLALRNQINPEEGFDELFLRVKQNTLNAYSHQMYPFDRLVEELDLARDTSRSAVFDVMMVLQNNGENVSDFELPLGQQDQVFDHGSKTSKFDLLINIQEQGEYLWFSVEYNTDVYEGEMIERFINHYKSLVSKLLSAPKQALRNIVYLSEQEQQELLLSFNDTKADYSERTVMELFEHQVSQTPDKLALIFEECTLTYKELNERSNVLANILKEKHQASNTTKIGVMLERSLESVIAMIGVMKAGACYVPIDHDYPSERVAYIAEDSQLEVIISEKELFKKHGIKTCTLVDIKKIDVVNEKKTNPKNSNNLDDSSYVIYTSGSTGKPKGVVQTHRMMSNLIQWDIHHSGIERNLKHLQYTSFSFDVSLQDCWSVLNAGGSLYVSNEKIRIDFPLLWAYILTNGLQVLSFPFSAFQQLSTQNFIDSSMAIDIKHIVCSGEQLIINSSLKNFLESHPKLVLHNHYGPSETHVVTSYKINSELGNIEPRASIGKPVSNSRIYILDAFYNLVPKGVKGELYIGGANLAKGYLNKEEFTKERFVEDPFKPGMVLYKTGDLGKWLPNETIEYLGRVDDQVKIRGYRIELGEVEHALLKNEQIKEAVILVKENQVHEKELVAYFSSKAEQTLNDLRSYLKEFLPEYMLPSYYVQMESLPLTRNGKIDKKSLPDPQGLGLSSGVEYIAPRNEIEEKLVKIWQEVLKRDNIGVKDDFFILGGHSLKAVRLISAVQKDFGFKLDIRNLFQNTSIELLAKEIERISWLADKKEQSNSSFNIIEV
ncbi:MAG: amino acid adenylation domain-containing protein [Leadbetterella sp.]|nr:amino acid adenylation domain-containing protein [Leadbetterella sp.]